MEWLRYAIAKYLKELYECDLYAIYDTDRVSTNYFKKQKIVNFEKVWFFREYISKNVEKIDINYLKNFENKYKINLWEIAFGERFFFGYNQFYKFDSKKILEILEMECKLFEQVLDEIKPDCLIIKMTDSHQSHLIHQLCKSKGIQVLMFGATRFAYRNAIYTDYDIFENFNLSELNLNSGRSLEELQNYLTKNYALKETKNWEKKSKLNITQRFRKYFSYLIIMQEKDFHKYYAHYGKTLTHIITQFLFLKRMVRKSFIDKHLDKSLETKNKIIYFPLHVEPERSISLVSPYHTDQIALISQIAKALPIDCELFVKEHGGMSIYGWRKTSFYKRIMVLSNVRLIHPSLDSVELIKKSSLVISIAGTSAIEAPFYEKPSIIFADTSFSQLPFIHRLREIEKLPSAIKKMLDVKVDLKYLNGYVDFIEKNSIEIDFLNLYLSFNNFFFEEFNYYGKEITETKMIDYLKKHKSDFEKLAKQHIKFIKSKTN
jgi:hypothetical protein